MALAYTMYNHPGLFFLAVSIIIFWTLVWKGIGLWYAGKYRQKKWFMAILVLNTAGILPIIYLIWFRPRENDAVTWRKQNALQVRVERQQKSKTRIGIKSQARIKSASVRSRVKL